MLYQGYNSFSSELYSLLSKLDFESDQMVTEFFPHLPNANSYQNHQSLYSIDLFYNSILFLRDENRMLLLFFRLFLLIFDSALYLYGQ